MSFFKRDTSRDAAIQQDFINLAERRGLEVEGQFPSLSLMGSEAHFKYRFMQYEREYNAETPDGHTTRKAWYSAALVQDRTWLKDLFVDEEHLLHRIVQFFGAQDIKVGNPAFDAAFTIKCSDVDYAKRLLTPAAQAALLAARAQKPMVRILNGDLICEYGGLVEDAAVAERMLDAMLSVARTLGR